MTTPGSAINQHPEDIPVLIDADRIAQRVSELATELERDLGTLDAEVTLVPVMTGSMLFVSDLIRQLRIPMRIEPVTVQSYPGTATHSRGARLQTPIPEVLRGTHVVIVDDIFELWAVELDEKLSDIHLSQVSQRSAHQTIILPDVQSAACKSPRAPACTLA